MLVETIGGSIIFPLLFLSIGNYNRWITRTADWGSACFAYRAVVCSDPKATAWYVRTQTIFYLRWFMHTKKKKKSHLFNCLGIYIYFDPPPPLFLIISRFLIDYIKSHVWIENQHFFPKFLRTWRNPFLQTKLLFLIFFFKL